VLSSNGTPLRLTISRFTIFLFVLMTLSCFTILGIGAHDYYNLRLKGFNAQELESKIFSQDNLLASQRKQIQVFSDEINSLKSGIIALNNFEKQIRIIANLDHPEAQTGLFGIGGSTPEDLDSKIELTESHKGLIREMHSQVDELDTATQVQKEGFESLLHELDEKKYLLACTPAIKPAKGLYTSKFGRRKSPFTGLSEFHKGLDIAGPVGTPVLASAGGSVTFASTKGAFGKIVIINHGHGLVTRYAHLSRFLKKRGEKVERGEKIALMGNTGRSTGPHLHYEVSLNGIPVDPQKYILN
ncbi:M23 family metallopeptidase, partial [Desulfobacterales bacterium HSG17]|nr:M23 family metallopeptidase [Desulfobacterales bacterium HSG17]